jgi:prepilin-type N-terminal cleavage/methylation domain-containing protein
MKYLQRAKTNQSGFTIIELLIATLVFSMILLMVTIGVIQITRVYYKGITEANTQNTARAVMDEITQGIQFSGGKVSATQTGQASFCIGDQQYSYALGKQLGSQTTKALWKTNTPGCSGNPAAASSGKEFLSPKMRLSNLAVSSLGNNLWKVSLTVTYGDDDMMTNPASTSPKCKGIQAGSQFCSISTLTSTVIQRVTSN